VLLQAYTEAIPHLEEGTFQTQPPSHQYCYGYRWEHCAALCPIQEGGREKHRPKFAKHK